MCFCSFLYAFTKHISFLASLSPLMWEDLRVLGAPIILNLRLHG